MLEIAPVLAVHGIECVKVKRDGVLRVFGKERFYGVLQDGVFHGRWKFLDDSIFVLEAECIEKVDQDGGVFFQQPIAEQAVGGLIQRWPAQAGNHRRVPFISRLTFQKDRP